MLGQIKEVNEILERERRKCRVVVTNLTDNANTPGEMYNQVGELLEALNVTKGNIIQVFHLKGIFILVRN